MALLEELCLWNWFQHLELAADGSRCELSGVPATKPSCATLPHLDSDGLLSPCNCGTMDHTTR